MKTVLCVLMLMLATVSRGQWDTGGAWTTTNWHEAVCRSNLLWALDERVKAAMGDGYCVTNMGGGYDDIPAIGIWASSNWMAKFDAMLTGILTNYYVDVDRMTTNGYHGNDAGADADACQWTLTNACLVVGYTNQVSLSQRATWVPSWTNYWMRKALLNLMTTTAVYWTTWANPPVEDPTTNRWVYVGPSESSYAAAVANVDAGVTNHVTDGTPHAYFSVSRYGDTYSAETDHGWAKPEGYCAVTSFTKYATLWAAATKGSADSFEDHGYYISETWDDMEIGVDANWNNTWTNSSWFISDWPGHPETAPPEPGEDSTTIVGFQAYGIWLMNWVQDANGFKYR